MSINTDSKFRFIANSDIHYDQNGISKDAKKDHVESKVVSIIEKQGAESLIG